MRITILGLPGSGKSTLARAIAEKLNIPHIHIDHYWFEAGGRHGSHDTPNIDQVRARVREKVLEAIQSDSWVSDGFYSRVQPEIVARANVIIYLDVPLWRRLLNHAVRMKRPSGRHREPTFLDDLIFFAEIVRRNFTAKPKLRAFVQGYTDKIITLHSRKEMTQYVQNL